jgi:hypothetical protein
MPVILATWEAEITRITVWSQPWQIVHKTLKKKTLHKQGLVEWLKVKALSSSPSAKKKKKKRPVVFGTSHAGHETAATIMTDSTDSCPSTQTWMLLINSNPRNRTRQVPSWDTQMLGCPQKSNSLCLPATPA